MVSALEKRGGAEGPPPVGGIVSSKGDQAAVD